MLNEKSIVIDIEYFRYRNQTWIIKEIAIYGDYLDSMVFLAPQPYYSLSENIRKSYSWITKNIHGLEWNSGDYPYCRMYLYIESIKLRYPNSIFYSKGFEKTIFLSDLFNRQFIDLDDIHCPKITNTSDNNTICKHSQSNYCARRKVVFYSSWLNTYLTENGVHET